MLAANHIPEQSSKGSRGVLQKVARGESEANTPRNGARPTIRAASAALEKCEFPPVPLTRHNFILDSRSRGARDEAARTPRYLLKPLRGMTFELAGYHAAWSVRYSIAVS